MKKWTKKLVWLLVFALLISACLLSFTACDDEDEDDDDVKTVDTLNGKTPLELFLAAKTADVENGEISGEMEATISAVGQGMTVEQTVTSTLLMQYNGETKYSKTENQTSGVGGSQSSLEESWLVGGKYYEHTNDGSTDRKVKTPMTYEEYLEEYGSEDDDFFIDVESGVLDGAKFKKDGDTYHVDVKLTGDQIEQYASDLVESFGGMVAVDTLNYRMSFDKDGNLKGFDISFGGEETQEGITMEMEITLLVEIKYGTVGTINPPEDAYRYTNKT